MGAELGVDSREKKVVRKEWERMGWGSECQIFARYILVMYENSLNFASQNLEKAPRHSA